MSDKIKGIMIMVLIALSACAAVRHFSMRGSDDTELELTQTLAGEEGKTTVVIDAGHGGFDPGKVGINGILEKEINLAVAKKLKGYLESNDIQVIMTRNDDNGLYSETDTNKKITDMKNRMSIIENSGAVLAVSIHQNSYTSENICGAQVFYYGKSIKGKKLAGTIQRSLKERLPDENRREIKANDSYYMLRKSTVVTVIAECGFLSNSREAELLKTDEYQEKIAWAISMGIMEYINTKGENENGENT